MHERRVGNAGPLRRVVDRGWDALSARLAYPLPRHVRREVEAFLGCGDLERGIAWLDCAGCDVHRFVALTCKGRGFCPTCGGRRMAERAASWCETLIPHLPVRQRVLSVPWRRRGAATGVITVVQRSGSR